MNKLIAEKRINAGESPVHLIDIETGKPVLTQHGSVYWNYHRQRWVMVISQSFGSSMLGEIWFAEASRPEGPWVYARKIVTHDDYSFYNPKQHPYFAKDGGRTLFFEATYTSSFSGNEHPTPLYDYNQIMYRLQLDDPRLNLPVPVYERPGDAGSTWSTVRHGNAAPRFFALPKPAEGTVPIGWDERSEEHTSELQSRRNLVCRLLLEKNKKNKKKKKTKKKSVSGHHICSHPPVSRRSYLLDRSCRAISHSRVLSRYPLVYSQAR